MGGASAVKELGENDENKYLLRNLLVETMKMVDFTDSGERFYASVKKAAEYINSQLDGIKKESGITVYCVGHTHIDAAWLWRLKHTREKCARSFATANRLMKTTGVYLPPDSGAAL